MARGGIGVSVNAFGLSTGVSISLGRGPDGGGRGSDTGPPAPTNGAGPAAPAPVSGAMAMATERTVAWQPARVRVTGAAIRRALQSGSPIRRAAARQTCRAVLADPATAEPTAVEVCRTLAALAR
jgi:hypothetical protein